MIDSKKTSFLFMQGGNNSRIGNTLVWLESAYTWCEANEFKFLFPQKDKVFNGIFDDNVNIFTESTLAFEKLGSSPISTLLSGLPQKIAHSTKEIESGIFVCELISNQLLFVDFKGREWNPSEKLVNYFRTFDLVILNEPFPFLTGQREFGLLKLSDLASSYCEQLFSQFGSDLISVHIRQGDYKKWNDGKYYRDNNFYNKLLRTLKQNFPSKSIRFMHNGEFTSENDNVQFAMKYDQENKLSPEICDFLVFAASSVIIGPLSTFTGQARLIGSSQFGRNGKIFHIEPNDDVFSMVSKVQEYLK